MLHLRNNFYVIYVMDLVAVFGWRKSREGAHLVEFGKRGEFSTATDDLRLWSHHYNNIQTKIRLHEIDSESVDFSACKRVCIERVEAVVGIDGIVTHVTKEIDGERK